MIILIFGANGMLGRYVFKYLSSLNKHTLIPITRELFEITTNNLALFLKGYPQIDWIINCAGVINKRPDLSLDEMYKVNVFFPRELSRICKERNIRLIHPSTDCVYSGRRIVDYDVDSVPDPCDQYGLSKFFGEPLDAIVIRTSVIGEDFNRRSLLDFVLSSNDQTINGYTNHYWNGITCLEWSKLISRFIDENRENELVFVCSEKINKYDLLRFIKEVYQVNCVIEPYSCEKSINRTILGGIKTSPIMKQIKELRVFGETLRDNVYTIPTRKPKISGENVVVITSVINIQPDRSVLSRETRFNQTLNSIQSIRKNIPRAIIVLMEVSGLSREQALVLSERVDYLVLCENDSGIQKEHGKNKTLGEYALIQTAVSMIKKWKNLFKLSGRYKFSEGFSLEKLNLNKFNFKVGGNDNLAVHTTFYNIPFRVRDFFLELKPGGGDIEHDFYDQISSREINWIEKVFVEGVVTDGSYYVS